MVRNLKWRRASRWTCEILKCSVIESPGCIAELVVYSGHHGKRHQKTGARLAQEAQRENKHDPNDCGQRHRGALAYLYPRGRCRVLLSCETYERNEELYDKGKDDSYRV